MLWDDFLKKALNGDYARKSGNALIDLKSVDKLGSSSEVFMAMKRLYSIRPYFIERIIAEMIPMEIGIIFNMWEEVQRIHMSGALLIAYDVDVTEYSEFFKNRILS